MRASPEKIALHVFERFFNFAVDVLNQSSATVDVQRLYPEANRQYRQTSGFSRPQKHHVSVVAAWNDRAKFRPRFLPITKRVYVIDRPGQADRVDVGHKRFDIIAFWN